MKRSLYLAFLLSFLVSGGVLAQKITIKEARAMIQGLWRLSANDSVTIAISGDSLVEYTLGDKEAAVYDCEIMHNPCDNEDFIPSPIGLYLDIGGEEDGGLCGALKALDERHFILILDKESTVMFEKMQ